MRQKWTAGAGASVGVFALLMVAGLSAARAADATAGRSAAMVCAECHQPRDWDGETQTSLESLIRDVMRGTVRHPRKIELGDAEIANIAAYWAAASR